jgi:hypothetical protein
MVIMSAKLSRSFLLVLLWSAAACQGYPAAPTTKRRLRKPNRYHHIGGLVAPSPFCSIRSVSMSTRIHAKNEAGDDANDKDKVRVGSSEYYEGFVTRSMNEEPEERVTGDAIITPILKGAAITSLVLGAFFLLFLKSNNLL